MDETVVVKRPVGRPKGSGGKYKKGTSGNPVGRPKGSKNGETLLKEAVRNKSEAIILRHFPKIINAVVAKAEQGDLTAAKMIMDRIIPVTKAVEVTGRDGKDFGIKIVVEQIKEEMVHSIVEDEESKAIEGTVIEKTIN